MDVLDNQLSTSGLTVNSTFKNHLQNQAYWAKMIGIATLIIYSLLLLAVVIGGSFLASSLTAGMPEGMGGAFGTLLLIFYAALIGFGIYMGYLLYNFGKKTLHALNTDDQYSLEEGASNLGRLFKISGILMLVILAFYALALIMALLGGGLAMFG